MPGGTNGASPLRKMNWLADDDQHESWRTKRDQRLHVKWRQGHLASWICRLLWGLLQLEVRQEYGSSMVDGVCLVICLCSRRNWNGGGSVSAPSQPRVKKYNLKVEKRGDPAASPTLGHDSTQSRRMRKLIQAMEVHEPLWIWQRGLRKVCLVLWEIGVSVI